MEINKLNWMVLDALGCMNTADSQKKLVNYSDVFIICRKLRHIQAIKKMPTLIPRPLN